MYKSQRLTLYKYYTSHFSNAKISRGIECAIIILFVPKNTPNLKNSSDFQKISYNQQTLEHSGIQKFSHNFHELLT